jgi:hypothetical protein
MLFVFGVVPARRNLFEGLSAVGQNGGGARQSFIAADDDVNMERIARGATAHPRGILGRDEIDPHPRKGSSTNSPRLVRSLRASSNIEASFMVTRSCRASDPGDAVE